jgi:hypothetical protein
MSVVLCAHSWSQPQEGADGQGKMSLPSREGLQQSKCGLELGDRDEAPQPTHPPSEP